MGEPSDTELLDAMEHHGWRVWWQIADDTWVVDPICPRCLTCRRPLEPGEKTVCNWCKAKHARAAEQQSPSVSHEGSQP